MSSSKLGFSVISVLFASFLHAQTTPSAPEVPDRAGKEITPEMARTFHQLHRKMLGAEFNPYLMVLRDNLLNRSLNPQLREYLKDQLYCISLGIDAGLLWKTDLDFGPVDYPLLKDSYACGRGDWRGKTYELAIKKHSFTKPNTP